MCQASMRGWFEYLALIAHYSRSVRDGPTALECILEDRQERTNPSSEHVCVRESAGSKLVAEVLIAGNSFSEQSNSDQEEPN